MISSVEPPPMSTTRRLSSARRQRMRDAEIDEARLLAAGDDLDREAERLARLAQERGEFFAIRSALVPTARTASRGRPRSRSRNWASTSSARAWLARSRRLSAVSPAPSCVCSRSVSSG